MTKTEKPQEEISEESLEENPLELLEQLRTAAELNPAISGPVFYQDLFRVECSSFNGEAIKKIDLPKFIMKPSSTRPTASEKSNLFLVFHGEPSLYAELLNCLKNGTKKITISILEEKEDSEEEEVVCNWIFSEPRIHAIDFGNLSGKREETREISVEYSYKSLKIDGVDFATP